MPLREGEVTETATRGEEEWVGGRVGGFCERDKSTQP